MHKGYFLTHNNKNRLLLIIYISLLFGKFSNCFDDIKIIDLKSNVNFNLKI